MHCCDPSKGTGYIIWCVRCDFFLLKFCYSHGINWNRPVLILQTQHLFPPYFGKISIPEIEGLCPTAVIQYIANIPPRQFSQTPHFASTTDEFPSCPPEDFQVKSTLLVLTVGRKISEFWHCVIYWQLFFETSVNWAKQQQCPCLSWKGLQKL